MNKTHFEQEQIRADRDHARNLEIKQLEHSHAVAASQLQHDHDMAQTAARRTHDSQEMDQMIPRLQAVSTELRTLLTLATEAGMGLFGLLGPQGTLDLLKHRTEQSAGVVVQLAASAAQAFVALKASPALEEGRPCPLCGAPDEDEDEGIEGDRCPVGDCPICDRSRAGEEEEVGVSARSIGFDIPLTIKDGVVQEMITLAPLSALPADLPVTITVRLETDEEDAEPLFTLVWQDGELYTAEGAPFSIEDAAKQMADCDLRVHGEVGAPAGFVIQADPLAD